MLSGVSLYPYSVFTHSWTLPCLQILLIPCKAVASVPCISLGGVIESGATASCGRLQFRFSGKLADAFRMFVLFPSPPSEQEFRYFMFVMNLCHFGHSGNIPVSMVILISSEDTNEAQHLFIRFYLCLHVFLVSNCPNPSCVFNWIVWILIIAVWELFIHPKYKLFIVYIYALWIFSQSVAYFSRIKKKTIVCQTVEDINEDQPTYFHLWRVLGIIFKKPLTHGTGVMAQSVMCFLCWVQSSQNIHTKTGHGGTHLQSQCWGGRDGQIVGAPQLII